jgi:hypothetical protein
MQWQAGKLVNLEVLSKAGQPLVLRYNGKVKEISTIKNKSYRFNASLELL